jgi:nucleoside-diphosphate-sugar epimerase
MKILITGRYGYIGHHVAQYLKQYSNSSIVRLDMKTDEWTTHSFNDIDVIIHCAGYVHHRENVLNRYKFDRINFDLTKKLASKAKASGVKHFIFISSMSVYGKFFGPIIENITPLHPVNAYGKSKLKAEEFLKTLDEIDFKVSIIRPPMVYGNKAPGNLKSLITFGRLFKYFPSFPNKKSFIHIDKLSDYIYQCTQGQLMNKNIDDGKPYSTFELLTKFVNVKPINLFNGIIKHNRKHILFKVFGDQYYDF